MSRIALISDIHANLPALEAVMKDIEQLQCDAVYCLGDIVATTPILPNALNSSVPDRFPPFAATTTRKRSGKTTRQA